MSSNIPFLGKSWQKNMFPGVKSPFPPFLMVIIPFHYHPGATAVCRYRGWEGGAGRVSGMIGMGEFGQQINIGISFNHQK
jgi:hypothetical protein